MSKRLSTSARATAAGLPAAIIVVALLLMFGAMTAASGMGSPRKAAAPPVVLFGGNVRVNQDNGAAEQDWPSVVATMSDTLHVLWSDDRSGDMDIYYSRSTDAGETWTAGFMVNDDGLAGPLNREPELAAAADGDLHAVWWDYREGDYDIWYSQLVSGTSTWNENIKVNDDPGTASQQRASIAVDDTGGLHVVWQDRRNGNWDIYYAMSDNDGASWSANEKASDDPGTSDQRNPRIAVDGMANAHVVWGDGRNGNEDIYAAKRNATTGTWGSSRRVDDDPGAGDQYMPDVAVDPEGNAHAVWFDWRQSPSNIYHSTLVSGTLDWSSNDMVNDVVVSNKQTARIAADEQGSLHVTWYESRNGHWDIYYARRFAGQAGWEADTLVNDDTGNAGQTQPSLALDAAGLVYIAWKDERGGDADIYCSAQIDLSERVYLPVITRPD